MITIDKIAQDLLNIIRGSNISQSEPISKRQIMDWINYHRALYMRRDENKNGNISPDYIQEINGVRLVEEKESGDFTIESPEYVLRTETKLPSTINLNDGQGFTFVGTLEGDEIQKVSSVRSRWQEYVKYTKNEPIFYSKNNYGYVKGDTNITYLTIRGLFEDPLEVMTLNGDDPLTSAYPVPYNLVETIKESILRNELNIEASAPTDNKNDSKNEEYGVILQKG